MSIFAKAKKARENKKGFTLVELIVVIVILAILAAILVPALLGWIDNAREKQLVLNANNLQKAAQAMASEKYAGVANPTGNVAAWDFTDDERTVIADTADVDADEYEVIFYVGNSTTDWHDAYTIKGVQYKQGSDYIHLEGSSWQSGEYESAPSGTVALTNSITQADKSPAPAPTPTT